MIKSIAFDEALEIIESLPEEQMESFIEVVRNRVRVDEVTYAYDHSLCNPMQSMQ